MRQRGKRGGGRRRGEGEGRGGSNHRDGGKAPSIVWSEGDGGRNDSDNIHNPIGGEGYSTGCNDYSLVFPL